MQKSTLLFHISKALEFQFSFNLIACNYEQTNIKEVEVFWVPLFMSTSRYFCNSATILKHHSERYKLKLNFTQSWMSATIKPMRKSFHRKFIAFQDLSGNFRSIRGNIGKLSSNTQTHFYLIIFLERSVIQTCSLNSIKLNWLPNPIDTVKSTLFLPNPFLVATVKTFSGCMIVSSTIKWCINWLSIILIIGRHSINGSKPWNSIEIHQTQKRYAKTTLSSKKYREKNISLVFKFESIKRSMNY